MTIRCAPIRAILVLFALGVPATGAFAAGTYKCKTEDGGVAYVNNHLEDYTDCVRIGGTDAPPAARTATPGSWSYTETRAAEAPPAPAAPAAAAAAATAAEKPEPSRRVVRGTMYKVTRADGIPEYTNVKPGGRAEVLFHYIAVCYACDVHSPVDWSRVALNTTAFVAEISAAAAEFKIDSGLLRALVHAESAFDSGAVSSKGAQGLAQLMPATARRFGVVNAFDPNENLRGGARYLAWLLEHFQGDERLATAAYNAGEGAVRKYGGVPPYAETQVYVERVAQLAQRYRESARGARPTIAGAGAAAAH